MRSLLLHRLTVPLATAALLGVVAAVLAVVYVRGGLRPQGDGEHSLSLAETASCAEQVFTGRVTDVDDGPPGVDTGQTSLTFAVSTWLKPATGERILTVDVPTQPGRRTRIEQGEAALVIVQPSEAFGVELVRGERRGPRTRDLRRALAASDQPGCPDWAS